jgi:hypothetical protein
MVFNLVSTLIKMIIQQQKFKDLHEFKLLVVTTVRLLDIELKYPRFLLAYGNMI